MAEGRIKRVKPTLESPETAYAVFSCPELRLRFLETLPIISLLCVWQAFPLLYLEIDLRRWIWQQFETRILRRFGIHHTHWMDPHKHAFVGPRVLEFLLGNKCVGNRRGRHELDLLFADRNNDQGLLQDIECPIRDSVWGVVNKLGMQCMSPLSEFCEMQTLSTSVETPVYIIPIDANGYVHFAKVECKTEFETYQQQLRKATYLLNLWKLKLPTFDSVVYNTEIPEVDASINPHRLKVFSLEAFVRRRFDYNIDEAFVKVHPTDQSSHCMLLNNGKRLIRKISAYRSMGFDIEVTRVAETDGEIMAYLNHHLMLGMSSAHHPGTKAYADAIAARARNIGLWVTTVAPKIVEKFRF